jgi:hypothetical protein
MDGCSAFEVVRFATGNQTVNASLIAAPLRAIGACRLQFVRAAELL